MKKKPTKRPVFQAALDIERQEKLLKVANHKGVSMSGQLRLWIDNAYNRLPKEAQ